MTVSRQPDRPTAPRPSPATDPTNPYAQEAAGVFVANEEANERSKDGVGLTDADRTNRDQSWDPDGSPQQ